MIRWGISALNHDPGIAVFKDDELIHFEYRREVDSTALPINLICDAAEHGGPDHIYWFENPWLKKLRQVYAGQYDLAFTTTNIPSLALKKIVPNVPVSYTTHHHSHAAAGYFTSPFTDATIVVMDAIGEFDCTSIWEADGDKLTKLWSHKYPNSIGLFYSAFTKLVNLVPIQQEHILCQMAAQGDYRRFLQPVADYFTDSGACRYNLHRGVYNWPFTLLNLTDQCDIAAAVQHVFELQVDKVMSHARHLTTSRNLVYMGGCAMNKPANIRMSNKWENLWSLPHPGDPSSAVGAVLAYTKQRITNYNWGEVKHLPIKT